MTTRAEFDQQLHAMAHTALREMSATPPVERRVLTPRRRSVSPLALAVAVAAAVAITAPIVASHSLHGGGPAHPAQPAEDTKPAGAILRDMTAAMGHLRSYHMVMHGTATDGTPLTFDVRTDRNGGVAETMTAPGTIDTFVIAGGTLYLKGPDIVPQEWQAAAGNHWISMPATDLGVLAATFVGPAHMIDCLTGTPGQLSTAGVHSVHGTHAVRVVSTRTDASTTAFTLDVADTGAPYALHLESSDGPNGRPGCNPSSQGQLGAAGFPGHETVDFDQFDTTTPVTAPTDVIDSATLPRLTH
jgi:hypothetical protein